MRTRYLQPSSFLCTVLELDSLTWVLGSPLWQSPHEKINLLRNTLNSLYTNILHVYTSKKYAYPFHTIKLLHFRTAFTLNLKFMVIHKQMPHPYPDGFAHGSECRWTDRFWHFHKYTDIIKTAVQIFIRIIHIFYSVSPFLIKYNKIRTLVLSPLE